MSEVVFFYLDQLRKDHNANAFSSLIELDDIYLPELIQAFYDEPDTKFQALLVNIIWEHRSAGTLTFLQEALQNHDSNVWKTALDGIVAINDPQGIKILADEKERLQSLSKKTSNERLAWVNEAYIQLQDNIKNGL